VQPPSIVLTELIAQAQLPEEVKTPWDLQAVHSFGLGPVHERQLGSQGLQYPWPSMKVPEGQVHSFVELSIAPDWQAAQLVFRGPLHVRQVWWQRFMQVKSGEKNIFWLHLQSLVTESMADPALHVIQLDGEPDEQVSQLPWQGWQLPATLMYDLGPHEQTPFDTGRASGLHPVHWLLFGPVQLPQEGWQEKHFPWASAYDPLGQAQVFMARGTPFLQTKHFVASFARHKEQVGWQIPETQRPLEASIVSYELLQVHFPVEDKYAFGLQDVQAVSSAEEQVKQVGWQLTQVPSDFMTFPAGHLHIPFDIKLPALQDWHSSIPVPLQVKQDEWQTGPPQLPEVAVHTQVCPTRVAPCLHVTQVLAVSTQVLHEVLQGRHSPVEIDARYNPVAQPQNPFLGINGVLHVKHWSNEGPAQVPQVEWHASQSFVRKFQ
jgi:hypothetical protein